MALTGNTQINKFAIEKFSKQFGENGSFRLVSSTEIHDENNHPKEGLFSHTEDFNALLKLSERFPFIQEITINGVQHYENLMKRIKNDNDVIPLFIKDNNGELRIIASYKTLVKDLEAGNQLVYLGKPIENDMKLD
jgi:hypothetical protein